MDIKELIKAVMPMGSVAPAGPVAPIAPPVKTKLSMSPDLMTEAQKVFQPGGEHKQGSPAPDKKGTAGSMETKGWAGSAGK